MQAARNLGICKEDIYCALIMAGYDVDCDAAAIEQAWSAGVVEESSATTPQVALPILVRAPKNSTTAGNNVEHDAAETATETGEDEIKSLAGTSTEDSYPIMARPRKNPPRTSSLTTRRRLRRRGRMRPGPLPACLLRIHIQSWHRPQTPPWPALTFRMMRQ